MKHKDKKTFKKLHVRELREKEEIYSDRGHKTGYLWLDIDYNWHNASVILKRFHLINVYKK